MSQGFDLTQAKPIAAAEDEGQTFHVHDEHGDPLFFGDNQPVTMTVAGTYSSRYRRAEESLTNRRLKSRRRTTMTAQEIRRDQLGLAAACVLDWSGFFRDGQALACTKDAALEVFEAAPWIYDQAASAMEDHAGFSASSSKG